MITTQQFITACGCRSVGECTHNLFAEEKALRALVRAFAAEMERKLLAKMRDGRSGWDDPACRDCIREALRQHIARGDGQMVDIANLAAMLWNLDVGTGPSR